MLGNYRIVFFDVGDTLAYPHPSFHGLIAQICQREGLNVTAEDVAQAEPAVFAAANRWLDSRPYSTSPERSRAFWLMVYETFLKEMGAKKEIGIKDMGVSASRELPQRLFEAFTRHDNYRLYPDAKPALQALRRRGLALGVISNWEEWLERLLVSLEVAELFDCVIVSGVAGVEKPDPRIFKLALEKAGVAPHEAVHVGDSLYHDVQGAQAVGITPVLIDRHRRYPEACCLRIEDLRDLERCL